MAKRSKMADRVFTVVFMAIVTFVCIALVAAIQLATAETVERNAALFLKRGVRSAAGFEDNGDADAVLDWYDSAVTAIPADATTPRYFVVRDAETGEITSYVFPRVGVGLWGSLKAVVGMAPDFSSFTGVSFTDQNETPGLGARITEGWFLDQVKGKGGALKLVPEPDDKTQMSSAPGELHAITGATITSTGVRDMLNELAAKARDLVEGA